jgi:transitional endoplasmic reticulum ATPase
MTSKWYGQSEKKVQNLFDKAKKNKKKTILYFDEFDALGANKEDSHEATVRIVSTILTNLDGLNPQDNTFVIASTNRKDAIDPALIRPGRIDLLIEVPLPDKQAREEIFGINFRLAEEIAKRTLFFEPNYDRLAEMTNNFSGADISEIVRRTLEEKVKEEYHKKACKIVTSEEIYDIIDSYERNKNLDKEYGFVKKKKVCSN